MSFKAVNWAWDQKGLTSHQKLVLLALANRHNPDVGCFPSLSKLVEDVEFSKSTVQRSIQRLQELGLIRVEAGKRANGSQTSNRYYLSFEEGVRVTTPHSQSDYPPVSERLPLKQVRDKQVRDKQDIITSSFDEFWEVYPKRTAKGQARKAWAKAFLLDHPKEIIAAAKRYAKAQEGKDKQFIPYPATWLNAERWRDEFYEEGPKTTNDILHGLFTGGLMGIEKQ